MKRIFAVTFLILLFTTLTGIKAVTFPNMIPGGKNYLDSENFTLNGNELESNNSIKVKSDTFYTLTFPGIDMLGENISIDVIGNTEIYTAGNIELNMNCTFSSDENICNFKTAVDETSLYILFGGDMLGYFYSYYGMENFQLEEGQVSTIFEEYIPPVDDTNSPEFSGTGAFITSYDSIELISTIVSSHVVVIDDIDGDISNQINITYDEYTGYEDVVGIYDVDLSVSDSSNNESYFTLTIIVKDEILPVITGDNAISLEVHNIQTIEEIISQNYTIYDGYDLNPSVNVISDGYTLNKNLLGIYNVTFEVVDSSLNKTTETLVATVVDSTKPIIIGDDIITSQLSNPVSVVGVLNSLNVTDNYDDMTNVKPIVISDGYTMNSNIPGIYEIVVSVIDSSGNEQSQTIQITVLDDVAPSISGPINYSFGYTNQHTIEDIISLLTVSDNVDSLTISDLIIVNDTYSANANTVGNYSVTVKVYDQSGNETNHTIDINVIDDVPPVIYVDNYIITVDMASTITNDDVVKLMINSAEIPNTYYSVNILVDEYTGNEQKQGIYNYKVQLTDNEGNEYEKEFVIKVIDENNEKIDDNLMYRNIVVYALVVTILGYLYIKKR